MRVTRRHRRLRFYWHNHWKASVGPGEVRLKFRHRVHAWRHYIGGWRHVIDGERTEALPSPDDDSSLSSPCVRVRSEETRKAARYRFE